MPKKHKEGFYHTSSHFAWIWTLTGICYSTGTEHSFCCFTDYTKLYVCAHRVLLLHDLRQDLRRYCPEFPGNGLTPALDWPAEPAGGTGVAGRSRWHGLHSPPEPRYWESICSWKMCIYPKSTVSSPGLRRRQCVLRIQFCHWMTVLSLPTSATPRPRGGEHCLLIQSALSLGLKLYCN